jgi:hypothetical protein
MSRLPTGLNTKLRGERPASECAMAQPDPAHVRQVHTCKHASIHPSTHPSINPSWHPIHPTVQSAYVQPGEEIKISSTGHLLRFGLVRFSCASLGASSGIGWAGRRSKTKTADSVMVAQRSETAKWPMPPKCQFNLSALEKLLSAGITRSDNKVRELAAVKVLRTSLLNTTVVALNVLSLGSYASMPAPSPPFETILEMVLCERPSELPLYYSWCHQNAFLSIFPLSLGTEGSLLGTRSDELAGVPTQFFG